MLAKFAVEYTPGLKGHAPILHYASDDPVTCEEFLEELLENRCHIRAIRHDGLDLPRPEFDRMIKTAAGMLASKSICTALDIAPEEEHYRFGFTA